MSINQDKKIKIVIVINDFLVGGAQKQIVRQLDFFDINKFDFCLITLFEFPNRPNLYQELPPWLPIYRLQFKNFFDLVSWFNLLKILFKIKPNIVISHLFFSNTVVRILKPLLKYKIIICEHNTYINKTKLQIFLDKLLSKLTYKIVAVSKTVAEFTSKQENIPKEKFVIIHNGINLEAIQLQFKKLPEKDVLKNKLGFSKDDRIIINVGRLTSQKNHKLLLDGFKLFQKSTLGYKLIILGDGALRESLEKYVIENDFGNSVVFLGIRFDVISYYKIADFFVSTSIIEGLSDAYLEAFACGLPLVATKTAGTDELIIEGKNGFFINEFSPNVVVESMIKLLNCNFDLLRKNTLRCIKNFDIRITVQKYTSLFYESIEND